MNPRRPRIIAFCGIDGAGKSTMVQRLRADPRFRGTAFVKKEQKENYERLVRLAAADRPMPDAYFTGPFAKASRWAHALDFLRFYEDVVRPLEPAVELIVSDRWSFCTITFADIATNLAHEVEFILQSVPDPTLTIYLDVEPATAIERIVRRGPLAADEHPELLAAYKAAYDRYFAMYPGALARIGSSSEDDAYAAVIDAITAHGLLPGD